MKPLRRQYLINKPFQLGYTAYMLLLQLVGFLASTFFVSWFFLVVLNKRLTHSLDQTFLIQLGIFAVLMIAGVVFWTIRYSHTIAGPVFKSRKVLQEAASGVLPALPVVFRKRDAFKPLADDLTSMLEVVRSDRLKLTLLKGELEMMARLLDKGEVEPQSCREWLQQLLQRLT
jgi:hypothetical protein